MEFMTYYGQEIERLGSRLNYMYSHSTEKRKTREMNRVSISCEDKKRLKFRFSLGEEEEEEEEEEMVGESRGQNYFANPLAKRFKHFRPH
jgi:hypothetical protein